MIPQGISAEINPTSEMMWNESKDDHFKEVVSSISKLGIELVTPNPVYGQLRRVVDETNSLMVVEHWTEPEIFGDASAMRSSSYVASWVRRRTHVSRSTRTIVIRKRDQRKEFQIAVLFEVMSQCCFVCLLHCQSKELSTLLNCCRSLTGRLPSTCQYLFELVQQGIYRSALIQLTDSHCPIKSTNFIPFITI